MLKFEMKAGFGFRAITLVSAVGAVMTLSACGTTSGATSSSNPAPISFKAGKVDMATRLQASARPSAMPYMSAPDAMSYTAPRAMAQPRAQAQLPIETAKIASNAFDQSGVDTDLYKHQRIGKPYSIKGKRYVPQHNPDYDETGIASWYGPNFHGKLTANGEVYDKDNLSAAHKTLPLNSDVFVTNLENGKTLKLRINDRGPFVDGRIIDLSEGAASALGVSGLSNVRVQYAGPTDPNNIKRSKRAEITSPIAPRLPQAVAPTPAPQAPVAAAPSYQPLSVVPFSLKENVSLPVQQPQSVAQAPVYQAPVYQVPMPQAQAPVTPRPVDITPEAPSHTRTAPLAPQISTPSRGRQEFTPPADGGIMTLTISGPIHMASASDDIDAQFIPAIFEGSDAPIMSQSLDVHYIQAATFSSMQRASSVTSSLSAAGPVSIHDISRDNNTLHRVLVGPFKSKAEATQSLSQVTTLGYGDARIVEVY